MPKARLQTSAVTPFVLKPITVIQQRYRVKRKKRLQQKQQQQRKRQQEKEERIHPIYLEYTPRDIAGMTDRALLNDLFDRYTPMSQPFWNEEADYLFQMMCAIGDRLDELDNMIVDELNKLLGMK